MCLLNMIKILNLFELQKVWFKYVTLCNLYPYFRHVFSAVKYCHNNGIVHWDIKDENILIDLRNRCAKLIDFGHAGVFNPDKTYTRYEGTRAYSPPEWLKKGEYHAESATVWTLGVVLYIMLQGDVPFGNDQEVLQGKLRFNRDLSNGKLIWICIHAGTHGYHIHLQLYSKGLNHLWYLSYRCKGSVIIDVTPESYWKANTREVIPPSMDS